MSHKMKFSANKSSKQEKKKSNKRNGFFIIFVNSSMITDHSLARENIKSRKYTVNPLTAITDNNLIF